MPSSRQAYPVRGIPSWRTHRLNFSLAFTLVELLVVIGIIAVLIGILLPSLSLARQQAQRVACAAKLQQILLAAQMHANDHKGFYPLAGVLPGEDPQTLDDPYSIKYCYTSYDFFQFSRIVAPITISLATQMSFGRAILAPDNSAIGAVETDDGGFIRHFLCPSQATSTSEFQKNIPFLYVAPYQGLAYTQNQSYIYNEAIFGWGKQNVEYGRLKGLANQIHQPTRTMFAADGLPGSVANRAGDGLWLPMTTVYNLAPAPVTLADAYTNDGLAGDTENFDRFRHRGKINVGFCDGHVETRLIATKDLSTIFLLAP